MFLAEKRLAIAVLAIVAAAGSLVDFAGLNPLVGGAVLLYGCLILVKGNACRAARVASQADALALDVTSEMESRPRNNSAAFFLRDDPAGVRRDGAHGGERRPAGWPFAAARATSWRIAA